MSQPIIYDTPGLPPTSIEFAQMEQEIKGLAIQLWESRANNLGSPMAPREQWPDDIRLLMIEDHLCWTIRDGHEIWLPVYMDGVRAHPRYNAYAWTLWDQEHEQGGIWWDGSKWLCGALLRPEKASEFMLTDYQLRAMNKPVPPARRVCPVCHKCAAK